MKRATAVLDIANTCTHCPHSIMDIGRGVMYCPCEDCHPGGLVQGREPKVSAAQGSVVETFVETIGETAWVDPMHSLD
jgi:hypothetical protein